MAGVHEVKQGEYLSLIANQYGFYNWRTIYDHAGNEEFRKKRPNPNVIWPGDRIYIPDKREKEEACPTARRTVFKIPARSLKVELILKDRHERKPLANLDCVLEAGASTFECKTDDSGLLRQRVPMGTQTVELKIPKLKLHWTLLVGHLDPTHQVTQDQNILTGVQARLNNLGYYCGAVDGVMGSRTRNAIRDFQRHVLGRTNANGELDNDTRFALDQEHAC